MEYIYTEENRLEEPHHYMYTEYGGRDFLLAYNQQREQYLLNTRNDSFQAVLEDWLRQNSTSDISFTESITEAWEIKKPAITVESLIIQPNFATVEVLKVMIYEMCVMRRYSQIHYQVISKWIKKFEVFKKVFTQYTPAFRKVGANYEDIGMYAYLSLACGIYGLQVNNLKFLNAQLKLNDLLCSLDMDQVNSQIKPIVQSAILIEQKLVERLGKA